MYTNAFHKNMKLEREVKMFTLTQCTPTSYDCIAGYRVELDKEYTLQGFIDAILTNKKKRVG